jgi:hypothetical protein
MTGKDEGLCGGVSEYIGHKLVQSQYSRNIYMFYYDVYFLFIIRAIR